MRLREVKNLILQDLYLYHGDTSNESFYKKLFLNSWFLLYGWFRTIENLNNKLIKYIVFEKSITYGIQIPVDIKIGKGFCIGHFGGIVVSGGAIIGNNCNISHNVTIGSSARAKNKGIPVLGDNCYIVPGVKIY